MMLGADMEVLGWIDQSNRLLLSGWAVGRDGERFLPLNLDVYVDGTKVATVTPTEERPDVKSAGVTETKCGFHYRHSPELDPGAAVRVVAAGTEFEVPGSENTLNIPYPPPEIASHAGDNFTSVGREFRKNLIELCGMQPTSAVLDIGCGPGRIAIPLANYISDEGLYRGFDVHGPAITWCQENITTVRPWFKFETADVKNGLYRKSGVTAAEYRFPYPDDLFDVVLAASVFTHLMPDEFANYLEQTARVMKAGGKALITAYVMNADARYLIEAGKTKYFTFEHQKGPYFAQDANCPEAGLAYDEVWVMEQFGKAGLQIAGGMRYGMWCGRDQFRSYQDLIVAEKM